MGRIKKRTFEKLATRFGYTYEKRVAWVLLFRDGLKVYSSLGYTPAYNFIYQRHLRK